MSDPAEVQTGALEDRYGEGRTRGIDRRFGYIAGGLLVLGGIVFLLFSGWNTSSPLEFRDIAHSMPDERTVDVTFEVTAPPNTRVLCAVEALNTSFATVGWSIVELPASSERTRTITESLIITNEATTGQVNHCWFPEQS